MVMVWKSNLDSLVAGGGGGAQGQHVPVDVPLTKPRVQGQQGPPLGYNSPKRSRPKTAPTRAAGSPARSMVPPNAVASPLKGRDMNPKGREFVLEELTGGDGGVVGLGHDAENRLVWFCFVL